MNTELMLEVASEMRAQLPVGTRIDMGTVYKHNGGGPRCGTVCCLAGYVVSTRCPTDAMKAAVTGGPYVFVEEWWDVVAPLACALFNITRFQGTCLFLGRMSPSVSEFITPAQVAQALERMAAGLFPWDPETYSWALDCACFAGSRASLEQAFPHQDFSFLGDEHE